MFRKQADKSIMCGYFCTWFINFIFSDKALIDYTNLFSPYDLKNNGNIILSYFKIREASYVYSNLRNETNLDYMKPMKLKTILMLKFKNEKKWVENFKNILLLLIILTRLQLFYL